MQEQQKPQEQQGDEQAGRHAGLEDELQNLRTAFGLLDRDRDGQVSAGELQQMLADLGIEVRDELLDQLLAQASNSGASLTESEFLQWVARIEDATSEPHEEDASQDLVAAFRVFDRDANGFITLDELRSAMEMIGESVSEAELGAMLHMADIDQDGRINYEEFARLLS